MKENLAMLMSVVAALSSAAALQTGFKNGAFEEIQPDGKAAGWGSADKFRFEKTGGQNASGGLVFENDDPAFRQSAVFQRVTVEPGGRYHFGGYVNVERMSKGGKCMFCLMWNDADGHYIGETQSVCCFKATDGKWLRLEGVSLPVAEGAKQASLGFYVGDGTVGRLTVDNVWCERHLLAPVANVYSDVYRDEAADGEVAFAAVLTPETIDERKGPAVPVFAVKRPDGTTFALPAVREAPDVARARGKVADFGIGTNEVACALRQGGKTVGKASMRFVRTATPRKRKVTIDRDGRTIVEGKPFFPIGMFTGAALHQAELDEYATSGCNCLMKYGVASDAQMDMIDRSGLKLIYYAADRWELPDRGTNFYTQIVRKYKDRPSVIGWYIYDERPIAEMPILKGRYDVIRSHDPDHPTWVAQGFPEDARAYIGTFDVWGSDPYPVPYRPVSVATEAMNLQNKALMGVRPCWQVPQFFDWAWYGRKDVRPPTRAEMRSMAWQAVAGGSRGFIAYIYHDPDAFKKNESKTVRPVWEDVKAITKEFRTYERPLLLAKTEAIAGLPKGVVGRYFRENGEAWRLLVNTEEKAVPDLGLEPLGVRMEPLGK